MYSEKYLNKIVAPAGNSVNVRKEPSLSSEVIFTRDNKVKDPNNVPSAGRSTGDYYKDGGDIWLKITLYKPAAGQSWGWVRSDIVKLYNPKQETVTEKDAQDLVNKLISSDVEVHAALMRIAPLIDGAKGKGINVNQYEKVYGDILEQLNARQEKIKNSKLVKWNEGIKKGYDNLKGAFKTYLATNFGIYINGDGIGSITAIVVGAVVGAGLAAAAYFAFRSDYDESTQNLKVSKELEKALASLTPEEAKKVKENLEKQIDTAASKGYAEGKFSGFGSIFKYGALAVGAYFLITGLLNKSSNNKK